MSLQSGVLANGLILSVVAAYFAIDQLDSDLFYRSVQEDEWLEWASVWAFLAGGFFFARAALAERRVRQPLPWFLVGLSLFCLWVALEEISWGQRLLGYRPPQYFLEHNFQQEFNLHNVVEPDLRKLGMKLVLLGYGVVLPLLTLPGATNRLLRRFAIEAPPIALVPSFLASYALYETYPLRFTGEIVEGMLGLAFAFSAIAVDARARSVDAATAVRVVPALAVATALVAGLGLANALHTQRQRAASPEAVEAARAELRALQDDFRRETRKAGAFTRCGLHKRLFTARERYGWDFLGSGRFAQLVEQGMPEERAEYLLDPWNYPYWVRDNCDDPQRRAIFIYSFGPNRLRDSNRREVRSDDLGAVILGAVRMPPRDTSGLGDAEDGEGTRGGGD